MIKIIRNLLYKVVEDIDAGNSNISENESEEIIEILRKYTTKDEGMSKYQACNYLNVSRATFDNHVREGHIPKGAHVQGFKELRWYKKDLDSFSNSRKQC
jgi:predicted DNA-binding transcriptional regulator AlpA